MIPIDLREESPHLPDAIMLVESLWQEEGLLYGDTGPCRFKPEDVCHTGSAFIVARLDGRAVGCGAIRPLELGVAELKRIYVLPEARRTGIARRILEALDMRARQMGYRAIRLETGVLQPPAIALYVSQGYSPIPSYGEHAHDPRSRCFEKRLS